MLAPFPRYAALLFALLAIRAAAAEPAVTFAPDGSATIVALHVPIPATISPEAQAMLRHNAATPDPTQDLAAPMDEIRAHSEPGGTKQTERLLALYPVTVEKMTVGGVPASLIRPKTPAPGAEDRLLVNLHGGAFFLGAGSIREAIPIAGLTGIPVLAVDYRLAPEHPFPAAVDDAIAVWRALLKTYAAKHMAIYGSSAGAALTAETTTRAKQLGLDLPAALGFFSGTVDFSKEGDTEALFGLGGLAATVTPMVVQVRGYVAGQNLQDPVLSPGFSDVTGFPPTLLMSGTRDFFLSSTTSFHRQLLRAHVPAELVVFDAMPHVFWGNPDLPETKEALQIQADFLKAHVMGAGKG
jgi:acetyl esterase/lipase